MNKDTIICDPWIEERSYFIGEINFDDVKTMKEVIKYLLPNEQFLGPIVLQKDILSKANGSKDTIISSQDQMVLRSRYHQEVFSSFNKNVPMCYESWDYPKEKHYQRQKNEKKEAIAPDRFFSKENIEEIETDTQKNEHKK